MEDVENTEVQYTGTVHETPQRGANKKKQRKTVTIQEVIESKPEVIDMHTDEPDEYIEDNELADENEDSEEGEEEESTEDSNSDLPSEMSEGSDGEEILQPTRLTDRIHLDDEADIDDGSHGDADEDSDEAENEEEEESAEDSESENEKTPTMAQAAPSPSTPRRNKRDRDPNRKQRFADSHEVIEIVEEEVGDGAKPVRAQPETIPRKKPLTAADILGMGPAGPTTLHQPHNISKDCRYTL